MSFDPEDIIDQLIDATLKREDPQGVESWSADRSSMYEIFDRLGIDRIELDRVDYNVAERRLNLKLLLFRKPRLINVKMKIVFDKYPLTRILPLFRDVKS